MLTPAQLGSFYLDLHDERMTTAIALVHSRFSTNTFPSWPLAHPYRFVAHNGEINTIRGNRNWMAAREALLATDAIPGDLERLMPVCTPDGSDSMSFDEVLELLHLAGRSLPHAVLMMIPEAWENDPAMDPARRAFYQFHASLMEPWDGPAAVAFSDGTIAGAVLDRNGLRPGRWLRTTDGLVVLASESGVLDLDPARGGREGPPAAGPDVPRRHGGRPHHPRRRDQGRSSPPRSRTESGCTPASCTSTNCRRANTSSTRTTRYGAGSRCSATPTRSARSSSRRWPAPATSRSDRWARTRRSLRCRSDRACSTTTSRRCSRRSRTRRWTRSGKSSSPACRPRSARSRTCSTRARRAVARSCCRIR